MDRIGEPNPRSLLRLGVNPTGSGGSDLGRLSVFYPVGAGIDPNEPKKEKKGKKEKKDKVSNSSKKVLVQKLEINDIMFHLANTDDPLLDVCLGLEQIAASMTNGTFHLKNLVIGNPGRLETPHLFTLDGIDIALDPTTIYSDMISIYE